MDTTFHGMGMIATFTHGKFVSKPIPRKAVTSDEIKAQHTGDVLLSFKELAVMKNTDRTADIDLLYDISLLLHSQRPGNSGDGLNALHYRRFQEKVMKILNK